MRSYHEIEMNSLYETLENWSWDIKDRLVNLSVFPDRSPTFETKDLNTEADRLIYLRGQVDGCKYLMEKVEQHSLLKLDQFPRWKKIQEHLTKARSLIDEQSQSLASKKLSSRHCTKLKSTAKDKVDKIAGRAIKAAENNPPNQSKSSCIRSWSLVISLSLVALSGCMTTQKAANEQARDAYWLGQSDATKQLYFAKEATQKPAPEQQRNVQYYAVPVEPVPGVREVPHNVVIPVEK